MTSNYLNHYLRDKGLDCDVDDVVEELMMWQSEEGLGVLGWDPDWGGPEVEAKGRLFYGELDELE